MTSIELDYNDQCDLVFGRIRRLFAEDNGLDEDANLDEMIAAGFDIKGLGLSGNQVYMAFDQFQAERDQVRKLRKSIEEAWGLLERALGGHGIFDPWDVDAYVWRDRHFTSEMLSCMKEKGSEAK